MDLETLRNLLPYWDKIVALSHSAAKIDRNPHLDTLKNSGVLEYANVNLEFDPLKSLLMDGVDIRERNTAFDRTLKEFQAELLYDVALAKIFPKLEKMKDRIWSYHEPSWGLRLPPSNALSAPSIQIGLYKVLPVPSANTPFDDILQFRQKREAERAQLHAAIHRLVRDVQDDPDSVRGELQAVSTLKSALKDLNNVSNESSIMSIFRGNLSVTAVVGSIASGAFLGGQFNIPIAVGAGVGGLLPLIEGILRPPSNLHPLQQELQCYRIAQDVEMGLRK